MYDFIYEVQEQAQLICGYDDQKLPLVGGEIGDRRERGMWKLSGVIEMYIWFGKHVGVC